jgi:hypothetical protein
MFIYLSQKLFCMGGFGSGRSLGVARLGAAMACAPESLRDVGQVDVQSS